MRSNWLYFTSRSDRQGAPHAHTINNSIHTTQEQPEHLLQPANCQEALSAPISHGFLFSGTALLLQGNASTLRRTK
eukprot:4525069-Amphidinium_carterae.1